MASFQPSGMRPSSSGKGFSATSGLITRDTLRGGRPGSGIELQSVLVDSEGHGVLQDRRGLHVYDDVKRKVGVGGQIQVRIVDVGLGAARSGGGASWKPTVCPPKRPKIQIRELGR